ncbi:MAG TPA: hypothetical protein VLQ29_08150 [Candidatus Dormibacteraeota bacterium]|nr:hypothetical protein [Candidatus Dormibacteraeota bacterium]
MRFLEFQPTNYWKNDIESFAAWVSSPKAKPPPLQLALDLMFGTWGKLQGVWWLSAVVVISLAPASAAEPEFRFDHDALAFANQTVFEYHEGHASLRKKSAVRRDAYNRHCFVLCRTAMQFKKFARFDPHGAPLDDASLATRVRAVTHRAAWAEPLAENQRIVFPGYEDLREMSKARRELLQRTIGHGWPSYFRISNARMMFQPGGGYQEKTHARLNAALARDEMFVGFLTTYPRLSINHSVLIYKQKSFSPNPGVERYLVYDPNHPESPRELVWSPSTRSFSYQKDWDFIGGFVRVYQVYSKWLQ